MSDELHVIVAGLHMYGRPGLGPFAITQGGIDGWDDGVALRGDKVARPRAHGSLALRGYQESRSVTLNGLVMGSSPKDREIQKNRLSGLLADGGYGRVQIRKGGLTTWATARKDSSNIDDVHGTNRATFQLQLWCPDARRYGELRTFTASVGNPVSGVAHRGNADATAQFVVSGNAPGGYTITIKGQVFNVTHPLAPGQPHSIDYGDGRLRIGGAIIHGGIGYGFTPQISGGVPTALAIAAPGGGTATATLTLVDTYI